MRWEALFADLEAQLAGADRAAFDLEVSERTRLDQSGMRLTARLRGHLDVQLQVRVRSGEDFDGRLVSVGAEWLVLRSGERSALIPLAAVVHVQGLGRDAAAGASVAERKLGLASALRGLSQDRVRVSVHLWEFARQTPIEGIVDRVGRDFLELAVVPAGEARRPRNVAQVLVVPLHAIIAVSSS